MSSNINSEEFAKPASPLNRPKRWLLLGGGMLCLISWIALAVGIHMDVASNTLIVLATFTALATEGLFWLAAAIFGITVFQARRRICGRLFRRTVEDER